MCFEQISFHRFFFGALSSSHFTIKSTILFLCATFASVCVCVCLYWMQYQRNEKKSVVLPFVRAHKYTWFITFVVKSFPVHHQIEHSERTRLRSDPHKWNKNKLCLFYHCVCASDLLFALVAWTHALGSFSFVWRSNSEWIQVLYYIL